MGNSPYPIPSGDKLHSKENKIYLYLPSISLRNMLHLHKKIFISFLKISKYQLSDFLQLE